MLGSTLGELVALDCAGAIGIKRFKWCLPAPEVAEELLELSKIDGTGIVPVKEIWTENQIIMYLSNP